MKSWVRVAPLFAFDGMPVSIVVNPYVAPIV